MSQNKDLFHPTKNYLRTCKYCNVEKSKFFTCKYCKERMCEDCMKHLCPQRENLARHVKFRDIDFRYIFLSVFLFLLGLGGFIIFVQLFDQVCNDIDESCVYHCADIYATCGLMGLGIAFAIKEIKAI